MAFFGSVISKTCGSEREAPAAPNTKTISNFLGQAPSGGIFDNSTVPGGLFGNSTVNGGLFGAQPT